MTGHIQRPMTDERLESLVREALAERADDVLAAAISAQAMADRIAGRPRPGGVRVATLRSAFAAASVLPVVGLLLAATVALFVVGSNQPPEVSPQMAAVGEVVNGVTDETVRRSGRSSPRTEQ